MNTTTATPSDTTDYAAPSARVERLKQRRLGPITDSLVDRTFAYWRGFEATQGMNMVWRKANALADLILTHRVEIGADELIVGRQFPDDPHGSNANSWPAFPEGWGVMCDKTYADRKQAIVDHPLIGDDDRQRLLELLPTWRDVFGRDPHGVPQPDFAEHPHVFFGRGSSLNHSVRDYPKVIQVGFEAIKQEIVSAMDRLDWRRPGDIRRRLFLQSALQVADAACRIGHRYADVARAMAECTECPTRRAELLKIAEVCTQVPAKPARNLQEALQALFFAHLITCWEDHVNANSIGRIDQMLYPAYERDCRDNGLTREQAMELLHCFHLKIFRTYDVQQACVGGQKPDGTDATNDLSTMVLDAVRALGLVRCMSVRYCKTTPVELLRTATDLISEGGGIPFVFNDETLVPALVDKGIPIEDARDYAAIGCVEITIPGKAFPHAVSHMMNVAKCLEFALYDGFDLHTGQQLGPHTGDPTTFKTFEDLWDAYDQQLAFWAERAAYWSNCGELSQQDMDPLPYRSILTSDCIDTGQDIAWGGARYNYHSTCAIGIPNVADAMAAVRQLVFEDKTVSMAELIDAMRANFEGHDDLRNRLLKRVPKYGNDEPYVDELAARVAAHYCQTMHDLRTVRGGRFFAHLFSFVWHINPCGAGTGAMPDGRLAGQPLAYSLSPMQGRDLKGLTAVYNSLLRIPHHMAAGSSSAIIEVVPQLFEGEGKEKFTQLLKTALDQGLGQAQFNVTTADTLEKAKACPQDYQHLAVRVSGYSYRFVLLGEEMQDHIIARTKHSR